MKLEFLPRLKHNEIQWPEQYLHVSDALYGVTDPAEAKEIFDMLVLEPGHYALLQPAASGEYYLSILVPYIQNAVAVIDVLVPPPHPNGFGGYDTDKTQILKSAAGWYIGSLYYDEEMGGYYPYTRISHSYWGTREGAVKAFKADRNYYEEGY